MNSQEALLEARDAGYTIEGSELLRDVNLTIHRGRICALVGPNGAGKTTLLRLLSLLIRPSSGRIIVKGQDATAQWPDVLHIRRRLALVTQTPTMFKGNVLDNVSMGLGFRGASGKEIREKVDWALEFMALGHLRKRYAPSLSSGEKQMVALARAIVLEPELLLLDEPTSNLDPENTRAWEDHVARLKNRTSATVIMVTHSLRQARRLADDAIFIHKGKIIETGSTAEFFSDPREALTRGFLGGELIS